MIPNPSRDGRAFTSLSLGLWSLYIGHGHSCFCYRLCTGTEPAM